MVSAVGTAVTGPLALDRRPQAPGMGYGGWRSRQKSMAGLALLSVFLVKFYLWAVF